MRDEAHSEAHSESKLIGGDGQSNLASEAGQANRLCESCESNLASEAGQTNRLCESCQ